MNQPLLRNVVLRASIAATLAGFSPFVSQVWAGGTSFDITSISSLGSVNAGTAAEASDASVIFANPAALTRFKRAELTQGAAFITIDHPYTSNRNNDGAPTNEGTQGSNGQVFDRKDGYDASALAPNTYVAIPLSDKTVIGFSASGSHGLVLHYDPNFPGRNQGRDVDFKVVRLNLALAHKVTDTFSAGVNLSAERFYQKAIVKVNFEDATRRLIGQQSGGATPDQVNALLGQIVGGVAGGIPPEADSKLRVFGTAYNVQLGVLWEPTENTRIGVSYRPDTKFRNSGKFTINDSPQLAAYREFVAGIPLTAQSADDLLPDQRVKQNITLNDEFRLSIFHHATPKLDLMATYTRQDFRVTKLEYIRERNDRPIEIAPQNYEVAESYRIGFNYRMYKRLTLRAGLATENGVVNDQNRISILPDSDRVFYGIGATLNLSPDRDLHLAYSFLDTKPAKVGLNRSIEPAEVRGGEFEGTVQLKTHFFGIGLTDRF